MNKNPIIKESAGKRREVGDNLKARKRSKKTGSKINRKRQNRGHSAEQKARAKERKRSPYNPVEDFLKKYAPELKAIVNSSPIPQFVIDPDHRILFWNRALEAISGIKAEDVIGTRQQWRAFYQKKRPTLADIMIDRDFEGISDWYGIRCNRSRYISEAYEGTGFFPNLGRDHKGLWLFFTAALIKDSTGTIIGANETLEDITERKQAEEALVQSEERFRQIAENTEEWIWEINAKGVYTYSNSVVKEILGYKPEEIIGKKHFYDFFPPDKKGEMKKAAFEYVNAKKAFKKYVNSNVHKNGSLILLETSGLPILNSKGELLGYRGADTNITERQQAEETILSEKLFSKALLDSLPGIFYLYTYPGLRLVRWNKNHETLLGFGPGEIDNRHILEWHVPEAKKAVRQAIEVAMEKGQNMIESPLLTKDGHAIPFLMTGVRLEVLGNTYLIGVGLDITERKRVERELRESEERWQFALEGSGDGVWDWDAQTNIVYFSHQWKAMLGYQDDEIGDSLDEWNSRLHPDDRKNTYDELNKHLDGKTPFYMSEHRLRCKNGEYKWILDRGKIISRMPDDKPLRIIGTHSDITERRQAEHALRESEERFRQLVEHAGEIIVVAQNNMLKYANPMTTTVTGFSEKELCARPFQDFIHPEDRGLVAERYKERISGAQPPSVYQFRLITKDGSVRWVEINGVLITWDKSPATLNFIKDITARRFAEEALKESEEKYRTLVDNMYDAVYRCDLNGNIVFTNRSAARMLGCPSPESMIGMNVAGDFYYHPGDREKVLTALKEQGKITQYEVMLKRRDNGMPVIASTNSQFYRDREGAIIGIEGVFSDITERKRTEEALRESENKYRELVENANSIILRMDTEGRVTFFNEFAQSFFGYASDEILGKNVVGTIVPETDASGKDTGRFIRDIARYPEKYQSNENENMKKNGERVWVSWTNKIIQDKKGKVKELLCIGNDITAHKKAEDALKNSEIKFRELADFLPEIVFELDDRGNVTYVNRVAFAMTGYSPDDVANGLSIFDAILAEDHARGWANFESILKGKRAAGDEYTMRRKDGSTFPVMIHSRGIKPEGAITGIRGIVVDMTDRKKAENALRESEEKFRRLFEDSGIAQFLLDGNRIIDCNIEAMKMMGCTDKSQLVQKPVHEFSSEIQPDGEPSKMKVKKYVKLALQQRSITFEWQYRRLDGELMMAEVVVTAIPMGGKDILHVNLRDITERKRLQNEIINIIDVEQQRLGQNLHDGLGQDLTGVAFMCNTLAKKLKELALPEATVSEEITSLVYHVITRVRMLSRELYPPNLVENEITYTLEEFASNTSSMFGISCSFSQDPNLVISDFFISTQIYYIVREAVNNSIKHGQARHIIISLTRSKNDVILVIEDDGIGRPEKMDKYKGLGLRIMEYRMATMNGTFSIFDNYKSGGVVVYCTFPIYKLQKEH